MDWLSFLVGFVIGFAVCGIIWFINSPLEGGTHSTNSIDEHWDG